MNIWIVYNTDRLIVGVFGNAADAAAWVAAGTGLVATVGMTTAAAFEAQPGQYYLTDGTITYDKPLSDLEILQQRIWEVHGHLINLWGQLQIEAAAHPWAEMIKVHDYFSRVHPTLFFLMHNYSSKTLTERTNYCSAMLLGPEASSNNPMTIPALFAAIAAADAVGTVQGVTYVNPTDNTHVSIIASLATGTRALWMLGSTVHPLVVTEQQLSSGDWINTLTQ